MRTIAVISLACCLAAAPVAAAGQTTILPSTGTLAPHGDLADSVARMPERIRRPESGRPPRGRVCLNQTDTRETIIGHRLVDPVRALRMGRQQGDALSAKLCRWMPDVFVYEINVLRRDGRILRIFLNAQNGEAVPVQGITGQGLAGQDLAGQAVSHSPDKGR